MSDDLYRPVPPERLWLVWTRMSYGWVVKYVATEAEAKALQAKELETQRICRIGDYKLLRAPA